MTKTTTKPGRRRVDDPRPQLYVEPAVEQWARERAAYDKTPEDLGHRPWGCNAYRKGPNKTKAKGAHREG